MKANRKICYGDPIGARAGCSYQRTASLLSSFPSQTNHHFEYSWRSNSQFHDCIINLYPMTDLLSCWLINLDKSWCIASYTTPNYIQCSGLPVAIFYLVSFFGSPPRTWYFSVVNKRIGICSSGANRAPASSQPTNCSSGLLGPSFHRIYSWSKCSIAFRPAASIRRLHWHFHKKQDTKHFKLFQSRISIFLLWNGFDAIPHFP